MKKPRVDKSLLLHYKRGSIHAYVEPPSWYDDDSAVGCSAFRKQCDTCIRLEAPPFVLETGYIYIPFIRTILLLKAWGLPKDLATWIVKQYIIIGTQIRLTCPTAWAIFDNYDGVKKRGHYHQHCMSGFSSYEFYGTFEHAYAQVQLFERK